jgi:hypothetical protein
MFSILHNILLSFLHNSGTRYSLRGLELLSWLPLLGAAKIGVGMENGLVNGMVNGIENGLVNGLVNGIENGIEKGIENGSDVRLAIPSVRQSWQLDSEMYLISAFIQWPLDDARAWAVSGTRRLGPRDLEPISTHMDPTHCLINPSVCDAVVPYIASEYTTVSNQLSSLAAGCRVAADAKDVGAQLTMTQSMIGTKLPFLPGSLLDTDAAWISLVEGRARLMMLRFVCKEMWDNGILVRLAKDDRSSLKVMVWELEVDGCLECESKGEKAGEAVGVCFLPAAGADCDVRPGWVLGPVGMIVQWGEMLEAWSFACGCNDEEDENFVEAKDEMIGRMALVQWGRRVTRELEKSTIEIKLEFDGSVCDRGVSPKEQYRMDSFDSYVASLIRQKWRSSGEAGRQWQDAVLGGCKRHNVTRRDRGAIESAASWDLLITSTNDIIRLLAGCDPRTVNYRGNEVNLMDFFSRFLEDLCDRFD